MAEEHQTCARCGATAPAPAGGLPAGWSLAASDRGVDRLCAACTRDNVRSIEARLDEDWW
ncbi:MAG TPA: hypothetical protein VFM27_08220 [Acidimicrobiales bacterium]|nr:hypothetical protein [Acidimicrobiales bacterium]